jgi:hypothetical protein
MIKTLQIITTIVLSITIATAQNTYTAPKTTALPLFDGDGSDAAWSAAPWQNIDKVWIPYNNILPSSFSTDPGTKVLSGAADFSGKYKVLWSETNSWILLLVEIQDDAFVGGYVPPAGGFHNFDVLELFIDENKSGGNHLLDSNGNNAENAFSYHIAVNEPAIGQIKTAMTGAMDLYGTTTTSVIDYQSHFPGFALKNYGNGKYVYELALKVYKDTYSFSNPAASLRTLNLNDQLGLSIAYCDNDTADGARDHFISSVSVAGADNNNSYINASLFGTLILGPSATLAIEYNEIGSKGSIYPNPLTKDFTVSISEKISLQNTHLKIYDITGREIKNLSLNNHQTILQNTDLQSGTYSYTITNKNKIITSGKLMVE